MIFFEIRSRRFQELVPSISPKTPIAKETNFDDGISQEENNMMEECLSPPDEADNMAPQNMLEDQPVVGENPLIESLERAMHDLFYKNKVVSSQQRCPHVSRLTAFILKKKKLLHQAIIRLKSSHVGNQNDRKTKIWYEKNQTREVAPKASRDYPKKVQKVPKRTIQTPSINAFKKFFRNHIETHPSEWNLNEGDREDLDRAVKDPQAVYPFVGLTNEIASKPRVLGNILQEKFLNSFLEYLNEQTQKKVDGIVLPPLKKFLKDAGATVDQYVKNELEKSGSKCKLPLTIQENYLALIKVLKALMFAVFERPKQKPASNRKPKPLKAIPEESVAMKAQIEKMILHFSQNAQSEDLIVDWDQFPERKTSSRGKDQEIGRAHV